MLWSVLYLAVLKIGVWEESMGDYLIYLYFGDVIDQQLQRHWFGC